MEETMDVTVLDVRPLLANGEEPFDVIFGAAQRVAAGKALEIIAPFEPMPLYGVLGKLGFTHVTDEKPDGSYVVRFTQTGIQPDALVGEIAERAPATAAVFAQHGIDLCCGGAKTLEFAAKAHGVALPVLLEELRAAAASA